MTIQPNDRKHEAAPELRDEAQQQVRTSRKPGKTDDQRVDTDVVANRDGAQVENRAMQDMDKVENRATQDKVAQDKVENRATQDKEKLGNQAPVAARTRLFEERDIARFRDQWRELQAGFVDEPRGAVREADTLVSQMMDTLASQLAEQKRVLQDDSGGTDTEKLRVALQRYRSLFDQMLQV